MQYLKKALKLVSRELKKQGILGLRNLSISYLNLLKEPQIMPNQPLFMQVEPTLHCNLKCRMCMNPSTERDKRHMGLDEFKGIIQKMPSVNKISLVGAGEPLLNPELFDMITAAKTRGILVGFATNGMLLNEDTCRKIADTTPDWINISVDSADKEMFESIREGANFNLIIENIVRLTRTSFRKKGPDISIWFVLMKDNLGELPSVIRLAKKVGIKKVCAQMQHNWGVQSGVNAETVGIKNVISVIREAKKIAAEKSVSFEYVNIPDSHTKRACKWPWKACYITAEGFITPCCLQGANPEIINFGNILNTAFDDIWNNQSYQDFRTKLKSKTPPEICRGCTAYFRKIKI